MATRKRKMAFDSDKSKSALSDPLYKNYQESIKRQCQRMKIPLPHEKEALEKEQRDDLDGIMSLEGEARKIYTNFDNLWKNLWEHKSPLFRGGIANIRKVVRCSQEQFAATISKAVKNADISIPPEIPINAYVFNFFEQTYWNQNSDLYVGADIQTEPHQKLRAIWKEIQRLQERLVLSLLPLALGRASQFWRAVPPVPHISHMDLVQYANVGLLQAIRKWRGPYDTKFRVMVSYAISSILIPTYSAPFMKMEQADLDTLYSSNKANAKTYLENDDESGLEIIAEKVNEVKATRKLQQGQPATAKDIKGLLLAQSYTSASTPTGDEDGTQLQDWWVDPIGVDEVDEDLDNSKKWAMVLTLAPKCCTLLERKALAMMTGWAVFATAPEETL